MTGLKALNILVVDDNAQMRTIIGTVLLAAGVGKIWYAPTGRHGLERLHERDFDVVYVDHEMPEMDGLGFIRRVRRLDGDLRYMPIIMLTGHADVAHICAARDAGMTEFLTKPVTARDILHRLNAVIMHPRKFVLADGYRGPDRRRRGDARFTGPFRRSTDARVTQEI